MESEGNVIHMMDYCKLRIERVKKLPEWAKVGNTANLRAAYYFLEFKYPGRAQFLQQLNSTLNREKYLNQGNENE